MNNIENERDLNISIALRLISEMKKPGRECLYDMSNKSYKNNHIKQGVWSTIAASTGMEKGECQALWKSLRRKYKTAKSKNNESKLNSFLKVLVTKMDYFQKFWEDDQSSVTKYVDLNTNSFRDVKDENPDVNDPLTEYIEYPTDSSQSICSPPLLKEIQKRKRSLSGTDYEESLNTLNNLASSVIHSAAEDETQNRKRSRLADAETEYEKSLKTLNKLASSVIQSVGGKIDPFFLSLQDEFLKVPENQKSVLKLKLMTLVVEHQSS